MSNQPFSMGWQRDLPDVRDYSHDTNEISNMLTKSRYVGAGAAPAALPAKHDLTQWCSPIEDQEDIGSCTAQAGAGLIEYYERRAFGNHTNASRLFLYKVTRNLLKLTGDTGAYLRSTMKAMALFGAPPESYYPYDTARFDEEPGAFAYAYGQSYQSLRYYRLDTPGLSPKDLVTRVKRFIAGGLPSMFGFTVYNFGNSQGEFLYPGPGDSVQGGHAVVAVGYDDGRTIGNETGALRIRNSWGTGWGDGGYGWLPYRYVEDGLAVDFWSLFKSEYVDDWRFE